MKFSVLDGGFKTSSGRVEGVMTFKILLATIKCHPEQEAINELRTRVMTKEEYDNAKGKIMCIKPHGVFEHYYIREAGKNKLKYKLLQLSNFLYFDIDKCDIESTKEKLLAAHGNKISLLAKSVGGKGLGFYVRIANAERLSEENFMQVWEYFRTKIFVDVDIDVKAKGLTRNHVLPFDSHVYYNEKSSVTIPANLNEVYVDSNCNKNSTSKKCNSQDINTKNKMLCPEGYTFNTPFIERTTLLNTLHFATPVQIPDGQDVLIQEIEIFKVPFIREITDKRHNHFKLFLHCLMKINPDITLLEAQSYIAYWNFHRTADPLTRSDMLKTVEREYNDLLNEKENIAKGKIITVHVRKGLKNRSDISKFWTGQIKKQKTINSIRETIRRMFDESKKVNQTTVSKQSGLSRKTVNQYWEVAKEDVYVDYSIGITNSIQQSTEAKEGQEGQINCEIRDNNELMEHTLQVIAEEQEYSDGFQPLEYYIDMYGEELGTLLYNEQHKAA